MNRRNFLTSLAVIAGLSAIDPSKLIQPKKQYWMIGMDPAFGKDKSVFGHYIMEYETAFKHYDTSRLQYVVFHKTET